MCSTSWHTQSNLYTFMHARTHRNREKKDQKEKEKNMENRKILDSHII